MSARTIQTARMTQARPARGLVRTLATITARKRTMAAQIR